MSDIVQQLLLQFILILLNAFFAATEIAVISLNEKKLKSRAEDGDKKAVKMLKMIEEPTRFLSTIQIGITLAGFLGSAFAADNFAERLSGFIVKTFDIPASQIGVINTASVILIAGVGGLTLTFGKITLTTVACALILGILTNVMLGKGRMLEEEEPVKGKKKAKKKAKK